MLVEQHAKSYLFVLKFGPIFDYVMLVREIYEALLVCLCSGVGEPGNVTCSTAMLSCTAMERLFYSATAQIFSLLLQLFRLEAATPAMPPWDIQ